VSTSYPSIIQEDGRWLNSAVVSCTTYLKESTEVTVDAASRLWLHRNPGTEPIVEQGGFHSLFYHRCQPERGKLNTKEEVSICLDVGQCRRNVGKEADEGC
jgi:hypothetical protein